MAMELQPGYLINAMNGKYYESDIYDDEKNRESVMGFDMNFWYIVKKKSERLQRTDNIYEWCDSLSHA